jgi:hypothetical protein
MGAFVSVCLSACAPTLAPADAPPFCPPGCRVEGRQLIRLVLALPLHVHLFKDDAQCEWIRV